MRRYQTILFDLDGTLTDPGVGITNSVAYALEKFGIAVPERSALYRFIGPPLLDSFRQYYGLSLEQARLGVRYYREYFRDKGIFENAVYDGIPALLADLKAAGKTVVLATSKPEDFARQILEHFALLPWFDCVAGATMDETRTAKADVIAYALQAANVTDPASAVMVGDREHDILGAKANGLEAIGVEFGYGSRSELEAAGAARIAATVGALRGLLL